MEDVVPLQRRQREVELVALVAALVGVSSVCPWALVRVSLGASHDGEIHTAVHSANEREGPASPL